MDSVPPVVETLMVVVCGKALCLDGMSISSILSLWWVWGIGFVFGKIRGVGLGL